MLHFAGDSLLHHNGRAFTTKDHDNDPNQRNCAVLYHGAWWYNECYRSNLNGRYFDKAGRINNKGIVWYKWKETHDSLKRVSMKIQLNN